MGAKQKSDPSSASEPLYIALDQGTTSSRAIVFSCDGSVRSLGQVDLPVHFPQDGWVEQDPLLIWETQVAALEQAVENVNLDQIRAIGISNQRETTIVWDRASGKPLAPAIVWQCRRSEDLCESLRASSNVDLVRQRSGLVIDPYFSASKIRWLYEANPSVKSAIDSGSACCGTVDSWLLYNLSNKTAFCTEASNASRTMLLSIHDLHWDDDLLSLWGLPKDVLPEVKPSAGVFTTTDILGPEIPVTGVLGDQQAALLGHGCIEKGGVKSTFGTGAFLLLHTGTEVAKSETGLLGTVAWDIAGSETEYALEGSIFIAGAVVQWLRDQLGLFADSSETEALAMQVESSDGVQFVPAFTGLGSPYWDPNVRAAILGMTRDTTAAHIVRAALEGCAHQLADLIEDPYFESTRTLGIDGGMSANNFFAQTLASICGCKVVAPSFTERSALGAARIAALGVGDFSSLENVVEKMSVPENTNKSFEPQLNKTQIDQMRAEWKEAVRKLRS